MAYENTFGIVNVEVIICRKRNDYLKTVAEFDFPPPKKTLRLC